MRWVVAGKWKLIVPDAKNEPGLGVELYDVTIDPSEENNIRGEACRPRGTIVHAARRLVEAVIIARSEHSQTDDLEACIRSLGLKADSINSCEKPFGTVPSAAY